MHICIFRRESHADRIAAVCYTRDSGWPASHAATTAETPVTRGGHPAVRVEKHRVILHRGFFGGTRPQGTLKHATQLYRIGLFFSLCSRSMGHAHFSTATNSKIEQHLVNYYGILK